MDKKERERGRAWGRVLAFPFTATAVTFFFLIVMVYVLPYVNGVGMNAYYSGNDLYIMYFLVPFTALDTVILIGSCKAIRIYAPRMNRFLESRFYAFADGFKRLSKKADDGLKERKKSGNKFKFHKKARSEA